MTTELSRAHVPHAASATYTAAAHIHCQPSPTYSYRFMHMGRSTLSAVGVVNRPGQQNLCTHGDGVK